ncbi:MAG: hypothetical protein ACMXYF_02935 [Candidatus Woesearchaeota archaeon]
MFAKKTLLLFGFITFAYTLLVSLVYVLRNGNIIYDVASYYILRVVEHNWLYDHLGFGGVDIPVSLTRLLMKGIDASFSYFWFQICLGLIVLILIMFLLQKEQISFSLSVMTLLLFITSSTFLFSLFSLSHSLIWLALLLILYFLLREKKYWAAIILTFLLPFFGFALFLLQIVLYVFLYNRRDLLSKKRLYTYGFATILGMILYFLFYLFTNGSVLSLFLISFEDFIIIFTVAKGFSLFLLILYVAGIFILWNQKTRRFLLASLGVFFISLFFVEIILLHTLIMSIIVSFSLQKIHKHAWENQIFYYGSLACLLVFFVGSFSFAISSLEQERPEVGELQAIQEIRPGMKVLSSPENGFLLESAGAKTFINNFRQVPHYRERKSHLTIFDSTNLEELHTFLDDFSITHIYLTPSMKEQYWFGMQTGMLRLLEDESFERVYNQDGFTIYTYRRSTLASE